MQDNDSFFVKQFFEAKIHMVFHLKIEIKNEIMVKNICIRLNLGAECT